MNKIAFLLLLVTVSSLSQNEAYTIVNLDMNTNNSHYGLTLSLNNKVYFSSPELNSVNLNRKKQGKNLIYSLFEANKKSNGQIDNITKVSISKNEHLNRSNAVISPNGKYIYTTANNTSKSKTYKKGGKSYNLFIERGEFVEGKGWTNFERLSFCDPNYSYGHPALSPDGKTLYFVSNIPSAKGPTDIFKVSISDETVYGKPVNLGELVNSVRKEMFPFISDKGVLYFSSDRANGVGGLDIYKADKNKIKGFHQAKLLPGPVNSKYDDFCYVIDETKKEGYFSSRRPNGKGDDDLYYFSITKVKADPSLVSND